MTKTIFKMATAMLLLANGALFNLTAQVTIGSNKAPESFSVLELVSNNIGGLRLPQIHFGEPPLTDSAAFVQDLKDAGVTAQGLKIFNMKTKCVQTWNGARWIDVCAPQPVTIQFIGLDLVIDEWHELVYGFGKELTPAQFQTNYLTITGDYSVNISVSVSGYVGTGSVLTITNNQSGNTKSFNLVLFGDADGDGTHTANDATICMSKYYITPPHPQPSTPPCIIDPVDLALSFENLSVYLFLSAPTMDTRNAINRAANLTGEISYGSVAYNKSEVAAMEMPAGYHSSNYIFGSGRSWGSPTYVLE